MPKQPYVSSRERRGDFFALVERTIDDLREYQRFAAKWLLRNPYSALFVDLGLGKTVIVLTVLVYLLERFLCRKVLIVAPIKVANNTWPDEIRAWQHTAPLNYAVLTGDVEQRRAAAADEASIHIINRENVPWLVEHWGQAWPYDVLIYDESSRLGTHNSVGVQALVAVLGKFRRVHELTATPTAQTYMKLFSQVFILDRGQRFGHFITKFQERYFTKNEYTRSWKIRPGAEEEITAKIADICLTMRRKDYLDMPDPVITPHKVKLPEKIKEQYAKLQEDFVLELPDEGAVIDAVNSGVLQGKLLQLSSGFLYDGERNAHRLHTAKAAELEEIVAQSEGHPILVAYWFKPSLELIRKSFPKAVVMDREGKAVKPWNRREIPILLVHPQSAAHGLNMQFGGSQIVVYDLFHSLELFLQLIGRLDRPGQTDVVTVKLLTAQGTEDEFVARNLARLRDAHEDFRSRMVALRRKLHGG